MRTVTRVVSFAGVFPVSSLVDTRIVGFAASVGAALQRSVEPTDPGDWLSGGSVTDGEYDDVLLSYIPGAALGQKGEFFPPGFPFLAGREIFVAISGSGFFQLMLDDSAVI